MNRRTTPLKTTVHRAGLSRMRLCAGQTLPKGYPDREIFGFHRARAALFDETDSNAFYYVIWRRDGVQLACTTNAPSGLSKPGNSSDEHPGAATLGTQRQMFHFTPPGEVIVIGHNLAPELKDLRRTAWRLTAVGGAVLLLGFAGGWWLASRAIRPIRSISDTAAKLSAGDLSQRINAADRESEFGELSAVLNSTFARLEAAFAQQKQFASDAAHELRTPISVLLTQTQSVLNRERTPEEYRQSLQACQRAAQRMRRLIESLLELARLDAGQEQMKQIRFNLSQLVKERVEEIFPAGRAAPHHRQLRPRPIWNIPATLNGSARSSPTF